MLRFEHPDLLFLLLILPFMVIIFYYYISWKRRVLRSFGEHALVKELIPDLSIARYKFKFFIYLTAIALIIISIANPQLGSKLEEVKRSGVDLVIALDVSNSMLAEDIKPNRLERAKMAINQLIDRLKTDRIGIVVFAGKAFTQLPITHDHTAAKMFLQNINTQTVNIQGTALEDAITQSFSAFDDNPKKNKAIIIISDGENHEDNPFDAAKTASEKNIYIHTIGIGSAEGAPIPIYIGNKKAGFKTDRQGQTVITKIDEITLQKIASIANGTYIRATNAEIGLDKIFDEIKQMEKEEFASEKFSSYESRFQYFLSIALILLILEHFIFDKKSKWLSKIKLFEIDDKNKNALKK